MAGFSDEVSAASAWHIDESTLATLDLSACPISHVTVFNDRAEVTRKLTFLPSQVGEVDVICSGLTHSADTDSLRVNRLLGTCTILEVSFDVHTRAPTASAKDAEAEAQKQASLRTEVAHLEGEIATCLKAQGRLQERREFLEAYVKSLVGKESTSIEDVSKALDFFGANAAETDQGISKLEEELSDLKARQAAAHANLKRSGQDPLQTLVTSRDVTVQLDVHDAVPVELALTYMVHGASWKPRYDIRVATEGDRPSLSVGYFGMVQQSTGEDWLGCSLSLSTAMPSTGGMPPRPKEKVIRYARCGSLDAIPPLNSRLQLQNHSVMQERRMAPRMMSNALVAPQMMAASQMMAAPQMMQQSLMASQMNMPQADMESLEEPPPRTPELAHAGVVDAGVGNVTFTIERKVQIKSGNKPHKVTIAALELSPRFQYFASPEQDERVYLHCRATNDSQYKLLHSEKAFVFFNGSFVTTTRLLDTSPGDEINTFLGNDGSVKCEYRNIKTKATEKSGFMSAKTRSTVYESVISVTNTKQIPVSVKVVGLMPRSEVEQITVEMTQPAPSELVPQEQASGDNVVMQNQITNNIVWVRKLAAGEKLHLPIKYTVTWPLSKSIEIVDK